MIMNDYDNEPMPPFQWVIISVQGINCDVNLETIFSHRFCTLPQPLQKILAQVIWKYVRESSIASHKLDGGSIMLKVELSGLKD